MKPLHLTLEGFKSFEKPSKIDFGYLAEYGIFGVAGSTGSGKTSILSALLYALFGSVRQNDNDSLLNLKSNSLSVDFLFELGGKRYRVWRTMRKSKSGNITKSATLYEQNDVAVVPLAERNDTAVTKAVEQLIGLDAEDFTQVSFLQQGDYDRFLSLTKSQRIDAVVRIFKLERYGRELSVKVGERLKAVNAKMGALDAKIGEHSNATELKIKQLGNEVKELVRKLAQCEKDMAQADLSLKQYEAQFEARKKYEALVAEQRQLCTQNQELEKGVSILRESSAKAQNEEQAAQDALSAIALQAASVWKLRELARITLELKQCDADCERLKSSIFANMGALAQGEQQLASLNEQAQCVKNQIKEGEKGNHAAAILAVCEQGEQCPVCGGVIGARSGKHTQLDELYESAGSIEKSIDRMRKKILSLRAADSSLAAQLQLTERKIQESIALKAQKIVGFEDVEDFEAQVSKIEGLHEQAQRAAKVAQESVKIQSEKLFAAQNELAKAAGRLEQIKIELDKCGTVAEVNAQSMEDARQASAQLRTQYAQMIAARARSEEQRASLKASLALKEQYTAQRKALEAHQRLLGELFWLVDGRRFISFIVEEKLQRIALRAGKRLLSLTDGRLELIYRNESFCIRDNFNGGRVRGVNTLSGGETFLASLSLALSIGYEISHERRIDFLFLDEGFGTLDADLIDTVTSALQSLRADNMTVGVISHRQELMQRLSAKLTVLRDAQGSRVE